MQEEGEVRLWADVVIEKRAPVEAALAAAGVGFRNFWHPIHAQTPYGNQRGPFPCAERVSRCGLWLPSGFAITASEIEQTCRIIRDAVAR
jgi:perosamine synthetase